MPSHDSDIGTISKWVISYREEPTAIGLLEIFVFAIDVLQLL
jgi:hypothetical protein